MQEVTTADFLNKDTLYSETKNGANHREERFLKGFQNAQNLLNKLERSIHKTSKYEARLLQCKAKHAHAHHSNDDSFEDRLVVKESVSSSAEKSSSRNPIDLAESWSTMSIVCLQYQYEDLYKRYESLLQAYDERCSMLHARDVSVQRLREGIKLAQEQLASTHEALLSVGEKYLTLRSRKMAQKCWYKDRIQKLHHKMRCMLASVEQAQLSLDDQLSRSSTCEHDAAVALLLAEIKKCNVLFKENMRLKIEIEELTSK